MYVPGPGSRTNVVHLSVPVSVRASFFIHLKGNTIPLSWNTPRLVPIASRSRLPVGRVLARMWISRLESRSNVTSVLQRNTSRINRCRFLIRCIDFHGTWYHFIVTKRREEKWERGTLPPRFWTCIDKQSVDWFRHSVKYKSPKVAGFIDVASPRLPRFHESRDTVASFYDTAVFSRN